MTAKPLFAAGAAALPPQPGPHDAMVEMLVQAAVQVFDTMVRRVLVPSAPIEDAPRPLTNVVGTVGFTGSQNGLVSFGGSRAAAVEITSALLGVDAQSVGDDLPDAIGEITNMVAGSFRTKMMRGEDRWAITTPVVTIGEQFSTAYPSSTFRVICPFTMGEHLLFVELVLQPRSSDVTRRQA